MDNQTIHEVAQHALHYVERRFADLLEREGDWIPIARGYTGYWEVGCDRWSLRVFYLDEAEKERVERYQSKGWQPFPGLVIGEGQKPAGAPVAIQISQSGSPSIFASNHTANIYAFEVGPGSSFIVQDHFHDVTDTLGQEHRFHIDLAFVLGFHQGEQWADVKRRLGALLDYAVIVWRRFQ